MESKIRLATELNQIEKPNQSNLPQSWLQKNYWSIRFACNKCGAVRKCSRPLLTLFPPGFWNPGIGGTNRLRSPGPTLVPGDWYGSYQMCAI